ncbi:MAG: glycoside hydrolase family 65 protein [Anaerolineae bacterium]
MNRNWHIVETAFDPEALHHKETVYTIGNGYLGTRGAFEEGYPGAMSMTLVHGLFDDAPIVNTELVNAPDWLHLVVLINGERFRMDRGEVLDYRRDLDLGTGVLRRRVRWRSPAGQTLDFAFERFASLADPHVLGVRCQITSVDVDGEIEIRAGIPGHVDNQGFLHWGWRDQGSVSECGVFLSVETRATGIWLCQACDLRVEAAAPVTYATQACDWTPTVVARSTLAPGQRVTADKIVTLYTARDVAAPQAIALEALERATTQGYDALRAANAAAWERRWADCNIVIEGDDEADRALRYSLFQLLIAAPQDDEHVSIPAKSLSGWGYRGHVFWDTEIFMLPFFIYTQPALARNMLMYRYHTLPGARQVAAEQGYDGALFAWESALTGEETTPRWIPDPQTGELVRIWSGDIEIHIAADVAYAVHQYWRVTGDDAFMRDYGAEIVLDTARFWASRAEWNAARGVYEITDVIGPDEYHDHVNNNAFTNRMARWNLETALDVLAWLRREHPAKADELAARLDLSAERLAQWADVIGCLCVPYDPETGLFEQFEGFFGLRDVDLEDYEPRDQSLQAILGIEGVQDYQILKQADVLMLLYLLCEAYDRKTMRVNWDYYTPRTDHTYGSSLGPAIQAALAARMGAVEEAYEHFMRAARTDLLNVRGNTDEGIHAASAGGLWQAAVFGFGGVRLTAEGLTAEPRLPPTWTRLAFRLRYRGTWHEFDFREGE